MRGDTEIFYGHAGKANEDNEEITRNSLFRIYSMTKPICVVAALILVDRGKLSLDDSLANWIPCFSNSVVFVSGDENNPVTEPVARPITVRDLMMHTSGMSYGIFGASPVDKILQQHVGKDWMNNFKNTTLEELCIALSKTPLSFQPGTRWQYSLSIDVLGRVVEVVSGCSLDEFFTKEIFTPLHMRDTSFHVKPEDLHRLVECYDYKASAGFEVSRVAERDRSHPPVLLSGGGGLVSSIMDYLLFAKSLQRGSATSLLKQETVELMGTNLLPEGKTLLEVGLGGFSEMAGPGLGFGLGVSVLTDPSVALGGQLSRVGEFGWGGVASTWFFVDPLKDLLCVFFSQVVPSTKSNIRPLLRMMAHRLSDELS